MAEFLTKAKSKLNELLGGGEEPVEMKEGEQEYVELDTTSPEKEKSKVLVRPFVIETFEGIKEVIDQLREGSTIALINIKPLKEKDIIELKRAINKLKKTTDALSGDLAGLGENYIVATPSFARIYRTKDAGSERADQTASMSPNGSEQKDIM